MSTATTSGEVRIPPIRGRERELEVIGALIATHFALMSVSLLWLQLMGPATLLLVGHAALVSKRFIVTERAKLKSDESSADEHSTLTDRNL